MIYVYRYKALNSHDYVSLILLNRNYYRILALFIENNSHDRIVRYLTDLKIWELCLKIYSHTSFKL